MIKYLFLIISLITINKVNAEKIEYVKDKKYIQSEQFYQKIFKEEESILSNNAKINFSNIDKNNSLSDYKKYLLNSISTFHILIAKDYNNRELLLQHAKIFFPITICFSYQFDKDATRQIENINKTLFTTVDLIEQFNKGQHYVFENFLLEKQNVFFKNIEKDFFIKKCSY